MNLKFRPINAADARAILAWNYEPPYNIYNASPSSVEEDVQRLLDPHNCYYAISDEQDSLIAFHCCGQDARVPGGDYSAAALDIGLGLRPDLTGQGFGLTLVTAVLDASSAFAPPAFRVTVAAFNQRSLRVWQKAGFSVVESFKCHPGCKEFLILMRRVDTCHR